MRRGFFVGLLTAFGLFSIGVGIHRMHGGCGDRQAFERHVAEICVQAAERTVTKSCASGTSK